MSWCSPTGSIATLVILRFQLPHAALALLYGVDRPAITRAVHEIRPLLAARGFAVPTHPGCGCTLAGVFAYAAAEGVHLRIDGTEVQVRRPRANRPGAAVACQTSRTITWIAPAQGMTISAATKPPNSPPTQLPSDAPTMTALGGLSDLGMIHLVHR